jgi:hypothetical protein
MHTAAKGSRVTIIVTLQTVQSLPSGCGPAPLPPALVGLLTQEVPNTMSEPHSGWTTNEQQLLTFLSRAIPVALIELITNCVD